MKAKRKASDDVLQRQYLLRFLSRLKATKSLATDRELIAEIVGWVKAQAQRSNKPGGIGRR